MCNPTVEKHQIVTFSRITYILSRLLLLHPGKWSGFVEFFVKFCFFNILLESTELIRYNVLVYTLHHCADITNCK